MIRTGKVQAVDDDFEVLNTKFDPWTIVPYSNSMLQESVEAFNELIEAIESQMPEPSPESGRIGLVDDSVLGSSRIPVGFVYEFMQRVQQPSFKFIAPGLAVPPVTTPLDQPFFDIEPEPVNDEDDQVLGIQPVLLFRSDQTYVAPPGGDISGSGLPFPWPYSEVARYPARLYLSPVDRGSNNVFEDESKLVLSFGIGSRVFARTSDGGRFGEDKEDKNNLEPRDTFADLYQPGYQPFSEIHEVRLVKILRFWRQMVIQGDWSVDVQGLVGRMEWRKADTEKHWATFVVPVDW